jgi:hypothetical protein
VVAARTAASMISASPGAIHTQWWSQLIGETSSAVSAHAISPANVRPDWCSSAAAASPATATITATMYHGASPPLTLPASRVRIPCSDWLASSPTKPVRLAWKKSPPNHQVADGFGSAMKPMITVTTNAPAATAACRNRRVMSR